MSPPARTASARPAPPWAAPGRDVEHVPPGAASAAGRRSVVSSAKRAAAMERPKLEPRLARTQRNAAPHPRQYWVAAAMWGRPPGARRCDARARRRDRGEWAMDGPANRAGAPCRQWRFSSHQGGVRFRRWNDLLPKARAVGRLLRPSTPSCDPPTYWTQDTVSLPPPSLNGETSRNHKKLWTTESRTPTSRRAGPCAACRARLFPHSPSG